MLPFGRTARKHPLSPLPRPATPVSLAAFAPPTPRRHVPAATLRWLHVSVAIAARPVTRGTARPGWATPALLLAALLLGIVVGGLLPRWWLRDPSGPAAPAIAVHFSAGGGCTAAVAAAVARARREVLVQAYGFTSAPIAQALVEARRRGADVQVLLDGGQRSERSTVKRPTAAWRSGPSPRPPVPP